LASACGSDDPEPSAQPADDSSSDSAAEPAADTGPPDNPDEGFNSDTIAVGWMGDLTGPTASSQAFNAHGSEAYFACANEDGDVLGRKWDFTAADDLYSPENATVNFTKLTEDDKILGLVGMGGSAITTQLQADVEKLNLPVIGPSQTIDIQFDGDQFFHNLAHYGDMADIAAGQIAGDVGGIENAVVMGISLEVPSGTEYAAYVEDSVTKGGGTYIDTLFVGIGATEVTAQMVALQDAIDNQGVNYVTLHGSPGTALVVTQGMSDAGITELPIVGIHGIAANSVWNEGPADVTDQMFAAHSFLPSNNDTEAAADLKRCAELVGHEGEELVINFAHGYLNAYIFHQAVLRAAETGEVTRNSVTEALKGKFDTLGLSCEVDWTSSQHSPCGAAFSLDPATGGMVPANPFAFYADQFDGEYGIDVG
ncbi:MAG: ABC transporter substrate-binding protein, partial [Acidimicrobiales bacterium]